MRSPMAVRMGRHRTEWTWIPESCPVPSGKRSSCNTQVSEGRYHWGAGELQGAGQWSGHGHWCEWQRRQILTLVPQRGTSFCLWGCKLPGETWWRPFYVGVWNHGKFDDITKRCRYFYFTSSARCWFHDTLYSISTSMWWTVEGSLTPMMSSTSSVLRVLATWAAMVVPNAIGPEGMRPEGPSLAPVGVNKHKLCWKDESRGVKRMHTTP